MTAQPETAVLLMAKQPQAGRTKTRLCPPLSPQQAADLYEALLKDTLALVSSLSGIQLAIAVSPAGAVGYFQGICPLGTLLLPVEGETIGVCLEKGIGALLERGFQKVLALNTDGPSLPGEYLSQAVALLDGHDLVLGPGEDGGYYLVGMKQPQAAIFQDIPWSTSEVLERTLRQARAAGLRTALTPPWYDVDTPADLQRLQAELDSLPGDRLVHTRGFLAAQSIPGGA